MAVGEQMRPQLGGVVESVISALRDEVPEYDQPLEGEFGKFISEGVTVALEQFVDLLGRDDPVPDLNPYRMLGRAELRAGRTLDALQSAYRTGARVAWRYVAAFSEAQRLDPPVVYALAEAIFAFIDIIAGASVAGYAQEQSVRAGAAQARRHALVELLIRQPPADPAEIQRAADEAAWPLPRRLAVLAVGEADTVALARRMPDGTLAAALDPVGVLVIGDPEGPGRTAQLATALRGQRAVLGPAVSWVEAGHSAQRAVAGWSLHVAGRLGAESLVRADDHVLELLLATDPRLAQDLAGPSLDALAELPSGARNRAIETLTAWLDAHGDVSLAAETLHVHAQTVRYRLARLRETLGDAVLDDPGARLELALALRAYAATATSGGVAADGTSAGAEPPPGNA